MRQHGTHDRGRRRREIGVALEPGERFVPRGAQERRVAHEIRHAKRRQTRLPRAEEVAEVFEVPMSHFFDKANHKARLRRVGDEDILLYDIPWQQQNIWGATAGMLVNLYRFLTQEARHK